MKLCKEIALLRLKQNEHQNHEERFDQKEVGGRGSTSASGSFTYLPDKSKHDDNPDKHFVKLKLRSDPRSLKLYLYEFKTTLSDNGDPEYFFCLFVTST